MGLGDNFVYATYASDSGVSYVVKVSSAVASEGGFGEVADPLSEPGWPFGPHNMRHAWGNDGSGHRTKLPIASPTDTKYTNGGTFNLHGRTYTIMGLIGERRALNALGG